jgi:hypothetical protein
MPGFCRLAAGALDLQLFTVNHNARFPHFLWAHYFTKANVVSMRFPQSSGCILHFFNASDQGPKLKFFKKKIFPYGVLSKVGIFLVKKCSNSLNN